jgi:hypothetical protein
MSVRTANHKKWKNNNINIFLFPRDRTLKAISRQYSVCGNNFDEEEIIEMNAISVIE